MIGRMAKQLLDIDEAREIVLATAPRLGSEPVPLTAAGGRVLAEDVVSAESVPGFDNSAMDGFAVRAADAAEPGSRLQLVGESRAGSPAEAPLGAGEAIAISTGAVIPDGCDAVVRVEDTGRDGVEVEIGVAVQLGANIRRAGDDIGAGERVLAAGTRLRAAELGVLGSVAQPQPRCARRPRVAVLSTGDELIGPADPMRPGAVRNSNAITIPALAGDAGAEVVAVERVGDEPTATRDAIAAGLESADIVVLCGGVSVGEHDHVKGALAALEVEQLFWGVSLKPGKPTLFGRRGEQLVFGLPGNPVSAFVCFVLFARPALLAMQGADPAAVRTEARLASPYEKPTDRAHALRCRLEQDPDGLVAHLAPHQGSHVLTSLLGADGLAMVPERTGRVEAGERVAVELLG